MKRLCIFFISCLVWCAADAASCEEEMAAKFEKTWKEYHVSALVKDGKAMEKYFNFPLKLKGAYHDQKPTSISKNFFLKNYSLIFIKNKVTEHTNFYLNLQKVKNDALAESDVKRMKYYCDGIDLKAARVGFGDLIFDWFPKSEWKITEISYDPEDKENLFDSVNNPDMEYVFP